MSSAPELSNTSPRRLGAGKLLLLLLGVLVLVSSGVVALWRHAMVLRVEEHLAALREAGEPITAADLKDYYRLPEGREDCTSLFVGAGRLVDQSAIGWAGLPIVGSDTLPPNPPAAWPEQAAVEKFLVENQALLDRLHAAAARGGGARYDYHGERILRNITVLGNCGRVLQLESFLRAHQGDGHGTAAAIHAIWRAGESFEYEPEYLSQSTRVEIDSLALDQLQKLLPGVDFSDEDLRMLQSQFRRFDASALLQRILRGDRAEALDTLRSGAGLEGTAFYPFIAPWEQAYYLETIQPLISAADGPLPQCQAAMAPTLAAVKQSAKRSAPLRWGKEYTIRAGKSLDIADIYCRAAARAAMADAALGGELFRRHHGRWPNDLDELVPDFLPAVPEDPFDGLPLRMTVRDGSLVVYSIGEDRADDGGFQADRQEGPDVVFAIRGRPSRDKDE